MKLSQGLQIRQEQRLAMTPEMLMSLNTLTLPVMDLREEIHKQVNENPALEILDERNFRISKRRRDKKGLKLIVIHNLQTMVCVFLLIPILMLKTLLP